MFVGCFGQVGGLGAANTPGGSNGGGSQGGAAGGSMGFTPAPEGEVVYPCPSAEAQGTIHYVCDCGNGASPTCVPGDDSNPGTSADAPMRTYDKGRTRFNEMAAGETVAFCRGGAFEIVGDTHWVNPQCKTDSRCTLRDYVPPWATDGDKAPLISALPDAGTFSLDDAADPDHEEGYIFANLRLKGAGSGGGFFFYNDIDDVLLCALSIDNFAIGVHIAASNDSPAGKDRRQQRLVVRGSRFTNNKQFGVLGGCDDCAIEDSYFENNGFGSATFDHNLYLDEGSGLGQPVVNMSLTGNELFRSTQVNGVCSGVSLVVHGLYDKLRIENNYVHEVANQVSPECYGISVDTGYGGVAEGFHDLVIRGNRVENTGGIGIGLNGCVNCLVENNSVVMLGSAADEIAIAAPVRGRDDIDTAMTGITIRNNSVYVAASMGIGILLRDEGDNHSVVSNAIVYGGTDYFGCLALNRPKASYKLVDNNICFYTSENGHWQADMSSLAAWQAATGFDMNSQLTDPGFKSVASPYDLSAASDASAMVGQGNKTQSSATSLGGKPRDAAPDVGAYER